MTSADLDLVLGKPCNVIHANAHPASTTVILRTWSHSGPRRAKTRQKLRACVFAQEIKVERVRSNLKPPAFPSHQGANYRFTYVCFRSGQISDQKWRIGSKIS